MIYMIGETEQPLPETANSHRRACRVDRKRRRSFWLNIVVFFSRRVESFLLLIYYNKENLERQETNKYGRGTERHLPKTDESVVRPVGERR